MQFLAIQAGVKFRSFVSNVARFKNKPQIQCSNGNAQKCNAALQFTAAVV